MTNPEVEITANESKPSGRKRLYIAGGSVLVAAALLTAAAFTDIANINLGAGSGIGVGDSSFALLVPDVDEDGNIVMPSGEDGWVSAASGEGISYNIPGADALEPNSSVSISFPVRNASPTLDGQLSVAINAMDADPSPVADVLLFSVEYADDSGTTTLFEDVNLDGANAALAEVLSAGTIGTFTVTVTLPNDVDAALQGQTTNLRFVLNAVSTPAPVDPPVTP